jgi:hypothetical protein
MDEVNLKSFSELKANFWKLASEARQSIYLNLHFNVSQAKAHFFPQTTLNNLRSNYHDKHPSRAYPPSPSKLHEK